MGKRQRLDQGRRAKWAMEHHPSLTTRRRGKVKDSASQPASQCLLICLSHLHLLLLWELLKQQTGGRFPVLVRHEVHNHHGPRSLLRHNLQGHVFRVSCIHLVFPK